MRRRRELLAIAVGGALGALLRTALVQEFPSRPGHWPWLTFAVNTAGSALLGFVAAGDPGGMTRTLVGTGFCGALTTFSTFQLELLGMLDHERPALALAYAAASVLAGALAVLGARAAAPLPRTAD